MDFPIFCILGERGGGKNLVATSLAYLYTTVEERPVIANYHIKKMPNFTYMEFKDIKKIFDTIEDCVIIIDEGHVGADAYNFFSKDVRGFTTFITQLRKRRVTLYLLTQRFSTLAKRFRDMVNFILQVEMTDINGIVNVEVYDRSRPMDESFINTFQVDGRKFYKYYDTNEIITS